MNASTVKTSNFRKSPTGSFSLCVCVCLRKKRDGGFGNRQLFVLTPQLSLA